MFALVVFAVLVALLVLRSSVANYEPVRSQSMGPFSVELRRMALVRGHPNGLGGHAFPQPHEERLRVFRVAGLAVWRQFQGCELPAQVASMIGTLTARDFDSEFDPPFRIASYAELVPRWAARLRAGSDGGQASG